MNKGLVSIFALLLAVVLFFALNILGGNVLRGARVDLTEGKLYTLSAGSKNIAGKVLEPIRLTMYFSEKAANDVPQIKSYATRVREMLGEYARASGGKIKLDIVNPEPFSDAEDQAVQAGLVGAPTGRGADRLYFGLIGKNSTDKQQVLPFFDPQREGFLEYDVTRMVYLLSDPPKKTVGLMTWLPMEGMSFNPMGGQGTPPWRIVEQMKELFTVKTIETSAKEIPDDVGVLMVVHPKSISPQTQYAIDQFVLRGGKLLLLVDPNCEQDVPPGMNPMQAMQVPKASELNTLMAAWGVEMDGSKLAADRKSAIRVNVGSQGRPEALPYIAWMNLGSEAFNKSDPMVGDLNSVILATAGVLKPRLGAGTSFDPLVHTSTDSMEIETTAVSAFPDPKGLLSNFESGEKELTVAARITGKVKSAFPEGPPAPISTPDQPIDQLALDAAKAAHMGESKDAVNIVVVSDCDMLGDRFWVQEQRLFGQVSLGYSKISDNGDLVIGALDNLGGSSDLMSLRARSQFARPFERVQDIQRNAEQNYLAEAEALQKSLGDAERRISELQQQRPDGEATALLTPEQEQEIAKARLEMVETRKKLRDVQHQLRKDIEGLGSAVKVANMAIMPGVVALVAVGLSAYRVSRRKSDRAKAARG
jgi:ABC-type uncharacterized transport system involved in gliding motility auxiliary subunit